MDDDPASFRFGDFTLDPDARELWRGGTLVPLKPRYFDVLVLLLRNSGSLVPKDRFFNQIWQGVTVGDEALTQAIKDLRRALGDDASNPIFIKTLPKHGYRFIAPVIRTTPVAADAPRNRELALAGTVGGGLAGLVGGTIYGLIAASGSTAVGAVLAVMTSITIAVALLGALGVCFGMAAASRIANRDWTFSVVGAALGGFVTGEMFHLLATRSFSLLIGRDHDAFTGGIEGLVLGGAIALGARLSGGIAGSPRRVAAGAALGGGLAGVLISLAGGKLMAASLAALARTFHGSQLELGLFGRFAGNAGIGTLGQALVAGGEGLLFGGCLVAAIMTRSRKNQKHVNDRSPIAHVFAGRLS